jgi:hypothetical protein
MGEMNYIDIKPTLRTGSVTSVKGLDYKSLRERSGKGKAKEPVELSWLGTPAGEV